ncbi:MAG: class I SAM-dependent methyltransferase [Armatimonadetes bacterium]|nr:class I SAM-dependent methyltransferase [Armatimonadota bacterium]MDW8153882.1 methyltransferase domain-containing protein [Armatimonadota bacterium]
MRAWDLDLLFSAYPYFIFFLLPHVDRYVGMDVDARRRPDVVGSAHRLPFRDRVADTVLCTEVLEHCYEPHDYFRFTRYGLALLLDRAGLRVVRAERIGGVFALCGARLTEVTCKTLARALKLLPRPLARAAVMGLYLLMTAASLAASRLFDWVDRTDAIGWIVLAQRPVEEAV